jgi:hypothetical protein
MTIRASSSLTDVAFAVCTALDQVGTKAVLTGGSAATYYAPEAYQSADLDFVITFRGDDHAEQALLNLGYKRHGQFYQHSESHFPLEFPPGPLMIGDELVTDWRTDRQGNLCLHVLSPTDSCRDRLAALLFWNDFSGLEQALAVCQTQWQHIDLSVIRNWCDSENAGQKFTFFEERLKTLGLL